MKKLFKNISLASKNIFLHHSSLPDWRWDRLGFFIAPWRCYAAQKKPRLVQKSCLYSLIRYF